MSYVGPDRSRSTNRTPSLPSELRSTRTDDELSHETDWQHVAVFGAGLLLGILVGAGAALLTAHQAGAETRDDLRRGAQRTTRSLGRRSRNAWLDLREELRDATTSMRRRQVNRAEERTLRRELARESRG